MSRDVLAMNNTYLDHCMSSPVLRARLACAVLHGCWASYRLLPAAAVDSAVTGYPTEPSVRAVKLSYSGFTDGEAGGRGVGGSCRQLSSVCASQSEHEHRCCDSVSPHGSEKGRGERTLHLVAASWS